MSKTTKIVTGLIVIIAVVVGALAYSNPELFQGKLGGFSCPPGYKRIISRTVSSVPSGPTSVVNSTVTTSVSSEVTSKVTSKGGTSKVTSLVPSDVTTVAGSKVASGKVTKVSSIIKGCVPKKKK